MLRMQRRFLHHSNTIRKGPKRRKQIWSYIDCRTICFRNGAPQIKVGQIRMNARESKQALTYGILWLGYIVATFLLFPRLNITCVLPLIPLIGLGAWLYGTTAGLWMTLLSLFHNFALTGIVYADQVTYYQYTFNGYIIIIAISYLVGHLRTIQTGLKSKHAELDQLVKLRNRKLDELTTKLLSESERFKTRFGQELHDSIGQQLTGIQLLSASLTEQLLEERNRDAALSDRILSRAAGVHIQIRKISRMLFPVKISSTGLIPALNELSSTLNSIKNTTLHISCSSIDLPLPDDIALQLYRICQEISLHAIDKLHVTNIDIRVTERQECVQLHIAYKRNPPNTEMTPPDISQLIRYRLARINGTLLSSDPSPDCVLECAIPLNSAYSGAAA
ncbi:sensor histidine kinase [Pontiella agarivorans]|uniref:Histidine kinase n=1 Tax=Pontiella agarivorans TaxID=3038953 RepID=A0ABU5MT41_9BACT|nr:histidine kinase [Pontiella agarivorans]MDZ8117369.1 histidine kinase [Pontiella agarivorans]